MPRGGRGWWLGGAVLLAALPLIPGLDSSFARSLLSQMGIAAVFATGGVDVDCLEELAHTVAPGLLDQALHWTGYVLETEQLMTDIEDAGNRISSLVAAAKQYSQMDRSPYQNADLSELLDSTLVMLARKIPLGVTVVKD